MTDELPLTRAELGAINARADEQNRTVQYIFARVTKDGKSRGRGVKLRVVRAIIRDFDFVAQLYKNAI